MYASCTCPDCFSGKIPATCAHEFTEPTEGGMGCWNCGAIQPQDDTAQVLEDFAACVDGYDLRVGDEVIAQGDYPNMTIRSGIVDQVEARPGWIGVYFVDKTGIRRVFEARQIVSRSDADGYDRSPRTPRPA